MFYFELIECPCCKALGKYLPSFEKTLIEFLKEYEALGFIILNDMDPPKTPEYIIFFCDSCSYQKKLTDAEALESLRQSWAKAAWSQWQKEVRNLNTFDSHFTRYLINKDGSLDENTLKNHPVLRDYIKIINEKAKPFKDRED